MTILAFILAGLGYSLGITAGVGFAVTPLDGAYKSVTRRACAYACLGAILIGAAGGLLVSA